MKSPGVQQDRRRRLEQVAARNAGYFTAKDAKSVGYSSRLQHHHAKVGNWRHIERGIYRLPSWPGSRREDLVLATLWSLGRGVVSHESALDVYEISDVVPATIHLTVPRGFRKRRPDFVLHRAELSDADIRRENGFRVTTPLRTVADVADSALSPEHLNAAVRDGLQRGLFRRTRLLDLALDLRQPAAMRLRQAIRSVEDRA